MHRWNRALITGASSGIGRAMAARLASEHTDLVLVARNNERLATVAADLDVDVEVLPADLSTPAGIETVADRLRDEARPIDLLVNNAGFGFGRPLVEADIEAEAAVVDVNVAAVLRLCHAAAATMAGRGRGGILNVSSVAGDLPSPHSATYAATKAFVTSFSESLHLELIDDGVVVSCLCPGLTHTEFHQRADVDYRSVPEFMWQDADEVAAVGLRALEEGKVKAVSGVHNRLATTVAKVAPGGIIRAVTMRTRPRQHTT